MIERIASNSAEDAWLWLEVHWSNQLSGEQRLALALLEDALKCLKVKKTRRETEEWLLDQGTDDVFSFNGVCTSLGLEAQWLRRRILKK